MKNYVTELYFYGSFHISAACCLLTIYTYLFIGEAIDLVYILCIGIATFFVYNFHRIISIDITINSNDIERYRRFLVVKNNVVLLLIILFPIAVLSFFKLDTTYQIGFILSGIICFFYVFPLPPNGSRVRDMPRIKIYIIAITWSLVSESVILMQYQKPIGFILLTWLERIIFFIALTLPFDIRDISIDLSKNVKTIANIYGKKLTIRLSIALLFGALLLSIIGIILFNYPRYELLATYLFATLLIYIGRYRIDDFYYTAYLDGLLFMPFLLHIIFH